jgi:hypothetical protein
MTYAVQFALQLAETHPWYAVGAFCLFTIVLWVGMEVME